MGFQKSNLNVLVMVGVHHPMYSNGLLMGLTSRPFCWAMKYYAAEIETVGPEKWWLED